MRMRAFLTSVVVALAACTPTWADLATEFSGFQSVSGIGVSGLRSSYAADTQGQQAVAGSTIANNQQVLGPARVSYPNGIGAVPSPGGTLGQNFDLAMMGVRINGGNVTVKVAGSLNPLSGFYVSGWNTWYNQGDTFLSVNDGSGVRHFALLNSWARDGATPRQLGGGSHFNAAQAFHLAGGAGGSSLEGNLVRLGANSDVTLTGGQGAYGTSNAPAGLDLRVFARGGTNLGGAGLTHASTVDSGRTWFLSTWTFSLASLTSDPNFSLGLHTTYSCGNDSINQLSVVPEPASTVLGGLGLTLLAAARRRVG